MKYIVFALTTSLVLSIATIAFALATNSSGGALVLGTKTLPSPEGKSTNPTFAKTTEKHVTNIKLGGSRIVYINGPIGPGVASARDAILELGQGKEPIYVLIDSPGGSVFDGAMVVSAIEASKAPVYTVCLSLCASMAAIIFEYGTKRLAVDRSVIMFHPASGGVEGEVDKMASRLTSIQRYIGKMEAYIATRAGVPFEKYKELAASEFWIDGEDAVNMGYADQLVNIIDTNAKAAPAPAADQVVIPKRDPKSSIRLEYVE